MTEASPEQLAEWDRQARQQNSEADAVIARRPDFVKYIGSRELLERFQRGEIVTPHDALTDQSEFVIRAIHRRARERLWHMLEGQPLFISPDSISGTVRCGEE